MVILKPCFLECVLEPVNRIWVEFGEELFDGHIVISVDAIDPVDTILWFLEHPYVDLEGDFSCLLVYARSQDKPEFLVIDIEQAEKGLDVRKWISLVPADSALPVNVPQKLWRDLASTFLSGLSASLEQLFERLSAVTAGLSDLLGNQFQYFGLESAWPEGLLDAVFEDC